MLTGECPRWHAHLSGPAYATPLVAVDVFLIECDELCQLLRHGEHTFDFADVEEGQ